MNYEKFIYLKQQSFKDGYIFYYWYLIDKETREGVHFHGAKQLDLKEYSSCNQYGFETYGIEKHSKEPVYEGQKPIKNCIVTCGDCYPDGTSLYASENLGHVNPDNCDPQVWSELEYLYKSWFENED